MMTAQPIFQCRGFTRLAGVARVTVLALFALQACISTAHAALGFDQVKANFQPSDVQILDRHGELLHRLRADASVRRGQWIGLSDVSPALRTSLVLSEDKRFYEHSGVDWQAVSAAAWANLWNTKTRGASTITMQLAGLLDDDLRRAASGRSVVQKLGQSWAAQSLEQSWRKDQILEAYLNLVPVRGELVGIDALSQTLFGKAAHGLDWREAAIAAALVRAPNATPAVVAQRACAVLKAATPANRARPCDGLDLLTTAALQRKAFDANAGDAPHLARSITRRMLQSQDTAQKSTASGNQRIQTSLRAPLQRFAVQTLHQHLGELRGRHVEDGAIVVLDNASGEVLAWVGSSGDFSQAAEVDGVTALRQPGSTLKPFLYAQAIAEQRITAASLLDDASTHIQTAGGLYIPQNYDRQFKGWVSARTALGASLNVPAVRTLAMVSPNAFHRQLRAVGLPLKESGDYYGFSLALGSAEVSLLSLANGYRTLANGGQFSPVALQVGTQIAPTLTPARLRAHTPPNSPALARGPALDPRASFIVSDILSDPLARARTFGTDSMLATRFWTAVKTGTSKDMRDNWAIGYSQRYTVAVWVGNANGAPMWDVSGTTGAAPIWAALMNFLHRIEPSGPPKAPAGLVQARVDFKNPGDATNSEAARLEWFLQGTQPGERAEFKTHQNKLFAINNIAINQGNSRARGQFNSKNANFAANSKSDITGDINSRLSEASQLTPRITSPVNGTIIALDPDIPPNRQRVSFTANGQKLRWVLDGKSFAHGNATQWPPTPGRHQVQLLDLRGEVIDSVRIEVRGAGWNKGAAAK